MGVTFLMEIYQEMAAKLGKLGRNEAQMTKEQFVQYDRVLKKMKNDIMAGSDQILCSFCTSDMAVLKSDCPEGMDKLQRAVKAVVDDERAKGGIERLKDMLFQTYSLERFLDAACRLRTRICYEAYAPYWVSKCSKVQAPAGVKRMGVEGDAWHSPIIDMYWHEGCHVWVSEKEPAWRTHLPPTKEMCAAEYAREKQTLPEG